MIQSRQVEAFRAVMLTGAMTAAAEMIHVTQPAVSRLVRDLEAELGLLLFRRNGNVLVPTAQARSLLEEVERSFVGLRRIEDFAADLRAGTGGSLRVAALPAMAGFLPRFVARFIRTRPDLNVFVDSLPSSMIRERVASGHLDVGVSAAPFLAGGLAVTALEDIAVAAIPIRHRLARKPCIEAKDLGGEDLILLTKFAHGGKHPIELALQGIRRGKVVGTQVSAVACTLVAEGVGVAVVDPFSANEFASAGSGVALRPFRPAAAVGTTIVRSSERALSVVAQEFHDAFVAHAQGFLRRADYLRGAPADVTRSSRSSAG